MRYWIEKSKTARKGLLKVILLKAQEKKRKVTGKAYIVLEYTYINYDCNYYVQLYVYVYI